MNEEQKNFQQDLNEAATTMLEQLVGYRQDTWAWLEQPHRLKDTKGRQKELQALGNNLSTLSIALLKQKQEASSEENIINANLRIIEIARGYEAEIRDCLKIDYDSLKKNSLREIDIVRNATFFWGLPGVFVTGVKNGVGNGHISVNQALVVGFAISIPTVFNKTAAKIFMNVAKAICAVPKGIQSIPAYMANDMRVVYARTIVKDRAEGAKVCFSSVAKSINDNMNVGKRQTASLMKRVFGRRGPKP